MVGKERLHNQQFYLVAVIVVFLAFFASMLPADDTGSVIVEVSNVVLEEVTPPKEEVPIENVFESSTVVADHETIFTNVITELQGQSFRQVININELTINNAEKNNLAQEVRTLLAAAPTKKVEVIVWLHNMDAIAALEDSITLDILLQGEATPFIVATVNEKTLNTLEQLMKQGKYVDVIIPNLEIEAVLKESRPYVKADQAKTKFNVDGKDVGVCVLDTGVDYNHEALKQCQGAKCKVFGGYDFANNDPDPMDDHNHGTHVAGIVGSIDKTHTGVATGARIGALKVLDKFGTGTIATATAGIDWCLQQQKRYNIKVATMSFSLKSNVYTRQNCPTYMNNIIQRALNANMFVDAASGNNAVVRGIIFPACTPGVMSVGSVDDATGKLSSFTDRDRVGSLDIIAPGEQITSSYSSQGPGCTIPPQKGFCTFSGTSMAAPHVAGAAALLLEKHSQLSPKHVTHLLKQAGRGVYDVYSGLTYPNLDVLHSMEVAGKAHMSVTGEATVGKKVTLHVSSPDDTNQLYMAALAMADTPPIKLSVGNIPLRADALFFASATNPSSVGLSNAQGLLDKSGYAEATFTVPPLPRGTKIYAAFFTIDWTKPSPFVDRISNGVVVEIV